MFQANLVNTLKKRQKVVAMVGDGVNDGLHWSFNIGVAMGKRELKYKRCHRSDFGWWWFIKMIIAVAAGRRIYSILKSNTLHRFHSYSIILTVSLPLFFGLDWYFHTCSRYFLELVMGYVFHRVWKWTCRKKNAMQQAPRPIASTFLSLTD
jgi:magnesium-transporting ATPase (P-type)